MIPLWLIGFTGKLRVVETGMGDRLAKGEISFGVLEG
jgi:hypothetical protein